MIVEAGKSLAFRRCRVVVLRASERRTSVTSARMLVAVVGAGVGAYLMRSTTVAMRRNASRRGLVDLDLGRDAPGQGPR